MLEMTHKKQQGLSMVSVIFILVVLTTIIAFMLKISATQKQSANLSLLEAKAFYAAEAGIAWASYHLPKLQCGGEKETFRLTESGLKGFQVEISCIRQLHQPLEETAEELVLYDVLSRGAFQADNTASPLYVSRRIRTTLTDRIPKGK